MNCFIKKLYKTDISHVLTEKNPDTFLMNMFLILLIYHLTNVFCYFPTLENNNSFKKYFFGNVYFAL